MRALNNKELENKQRLDEAKSLKLFKEKGNLYRKRDLDRISGTDYLNTLSEEDLTWYIVNSGDFMYSESTIYSVKADVYSQAPIHDDVILETYIETEEDVLITLLKVMGDKRLIKKYLREEIEDMTNAFPEDRDHLERTYKATVAALDKMRYGY